MALSLNLRPGRSSSRRSFLSGSGTNLPSDMISDNRTAKRRNLVTTNPDPGLLSHLLKEKGDEMPLQAEFFFTATPRKIRGPIYRFPLY